MKAVSAILDEYAELPEFYGLQLGTVNLKGHTGDSPLHVAVHRRDFEEVAALLAAGADPNARGELGYTPLLTAVSNDLPAIVRLLLQSGARKDVANDDGLTPWRLAKSEEVRALLKCSPDPN